MWRLQNDCTLCRKVSSHSQDTIGSAGLFYELSNVALSRYSKEDKYKGVHFAKVDVQNDALSEVAKGAGIKKLPTFQIFRGGKKIDGEIYEPKPNDLVAFLEKAL